MNCRVGLDIGSTTIKCVVIDENANVIYSTYERHYSKIAEMIEKVLTRLKNEVLNGEDEVELAFSGSAGMGIADSCGFPFYQEVYATRASTKHFYPNTDCIIELGGEDAKIIFMNNGVEVRMNGSCAGGTGAFIDQMASLLNVNVTEIDDLAKKKEKIYTIASRCGVFAKSDIQPLLNQGAKKEDIAASIFYAVVNQTIAGLAQGREITGNIVYLGGPLTFMSQLREAFDDVLKIKGLLPENSLYFVSLGAALLSEKKISINKIIESVATYRNNENFAYQSPLFKSEEEYKEFTDRHNLDYVPTLPLANYDKPLYLGVDSGSTTIKAVLIDEEENIRYEKYMSNGGNPVALVKEILLDIYEQNPNVIIKGASATGYGEDIIRNAFKLDHGIVETMAHFEAAKHFLPEVEFVIDIGGQDIKCFKIHNGTIDNIFLNEACSSGCGSFLQTFASALGYSIIDFSKLGLFAKRPVNLGSRCTVFMNSAVKQAQKDGATIEDISAGLSISVVKNALYKVIRASSKDDLGKKIVVQGGTFLNDAVLRAFEKELDANVVRANISGLMGAYGAALDAKNLNLEKSEILDKEALLQFKHDIKVVTCNGCSNHCRLTINSFDGKRRYIGGNRCEKPVTAKANSNELNLYAYKQELLASYKPVSGPRGKIGLPFGLNIYELLPFWHTFFTALGFEVITSDVSSPSLYRKGQMTIPSDTVCYPAKLMHGHVINLLDKGVKTIFYPCMSYNIDEGRSDNHYNCPVVAYYPEVIKVNVKRLKNDDATFINEYVGIHRHKDFAKKIYSKLVKYFPDLNEKEVKKASELAYKEYANYEKKISEKGDEIIEKARQEKKTIIVLAGRPYHVDPEINHGIDKLLMSFNVAIVTEDVIAHKVKQMPVVHVLNQWTYHARLYEAAQYIKNYDDMQLIQLVSFGCGVDAITSDEVRDILERNGKIYTQIKIDEITNLGAVKIRIRSLLAAVGKEKQRWIQISQ